MHIKRYIEQHYFYLNKQFYYRGIFCSSYRDTNPKTYERKSNESVTENMDICPEDSDMDEGLPQLLVDCKGSESHEPIVVGRRIVDISHFVKEITSMANHSKVCTTGHFVLVKETKKGLVSKLHFHCDNCDGDRFVTTEPIDKEDDLNDALVWGAVSVGIGYSQTEELLGVMDIPSMGPKKFRKHESRVGQVC